MPNLPRSRSLPLDRRESDRGWSWIPPRRRRRVGQSPRRQWPSPATATVPPAKRRKPRAGLEGQSIVEQRLRSTSRNHYDVAALQYDILLQVLTRADLAVLERQNALHAAG